MKKVKKRLAFIKQEAYNIKTCDEKKEQNNVLEVQPHVNKSINL